MNFITKSSWQDIILGVLSQLSDFNTAVGLSNLYCQNGIVKIFGNSNTSWNEPDARNSINQLIKFWNGIKVLTLDGGGSKGIYTIGVLKELEKYRPKIGDYFDYIYSTSIPLFQDYLLLVKSK